MKLTLGCISLLVISAALVSAQDKPRVFVQGKGSEDVNSSGAGGGSRHFGAWGSRSTIDSHDESMEVTKDLQKDCSGVTVTLNQSNADYTVMLNRESKKNRGLLRSNSQVQVANRVGDVLGTNATHTVGNAAKDACQLIVADWQTHGRMATQAVESSAAPAGPAVQPGVIQPAGVRPAVATQPQVVTVGVPVEQHPVTSTEAANNESVGDAAKRAKQHADCLKLAKDNPSVTCK
jgi:hypothetical protein